MILLSHNSVNFRQQLDTIIMHKLRHNVDNHIRDLLRVFRAEGGGGHIGDVDNAAIIQGQPAPHLNFSVTSILVAINFHIIVLNLTVAYV